VALIRQAINNLLGNAVKFTRTRETAKIEIGIRVEKKQHVYYIKDNGVGFDMQHADKLFKMFQRLHSFDEFEGNGASLAFVQRIIHLHGGEIWTEAQLNQGATFYFSLPRRESNITD
jgi:two-component system sensor kinase